MAIKRTFFLDENNDITSLNYAPRLTSTKREYVEATVKARCEVWRGEYYRDPAKGVPYLGSILGQVADFNLIEPVLRDEALQVDYVLDVVNIESIADGEEYSATLTLLIEGEDGEGSQTLSVSLSNPEVLQ